MVLDGIFSLVYPSVEELVELVELVVPEELVEPSFFAQPLKIISVNRTKITESIEVFIRSFKKDGYRYNFANKIYLEKLILSILFVFFNFRMLNL